MIFNKIYLFLFFNIFGNVNTMRNMEDMSGDGEDLSISNMNNKEYSEINLREDLFKTYNKRTIPVKNNSRSIDLLYGIKIDGLVFFDQKAEKIKINTLTTLIWKDEYLSWNYDSMHQNHSHNPEFIIVPNNLIWQPDLELYNAGSKPEIFETSGTSKLYSNGLIIYNRPTSYTFSCKMDLEEFPFDTQQCNLLFGSWKYSKATLNLRPFTQNELISIYQKELLSIFGISLNISYENRELNFSSDLNFDLDISSLQTPRYINDLRNIKNISVSDLFSHNEWNIVNISVSHEDIEYKCCPGELWPNTVFSINLRRNPVKYSISIIMATFITISSIIINLLTASIYRRTYILVFIPLTLIWLQIHTSSKIPVIEYSTNLEDIIQLCFYTTIISAFESGIIYNLILNKINLLSYFFTEKTFKKMETINLYGKYSIIKYDESNTNKYFSKYLNYLTIFDLSFRIILTIVFFSYLIYLL